MICRNCIRAAARNQTFKISSPQSLRPLSTCTPLRNATPISPTTATQTAPQQGSPASSQTPPAATPTSATQGPTKERAHPVVRSSIPAGTPLKGLNFLKNKEDPVAMEDSEYPNWLWEILAKQEKKAEAGAAGDLFSKSKKQRRLAAKRLRKEQLEHPESFVKKVPIYEQTIDLPAGDGSVQGAIQAANAREELTKAMRNKRRATIKEANFLKAMG